MYDIIKSTQILEENIEELRFSLPVYEALISVFEEIKEKRLRTNAGMISFLIPKLPQFIDIKFSAYYGSIKLIFDMDDEKHKRRYLFLKQRAGCRVDEMLLRNLKRQFTDMTRKLEKLTAYKEQLHADIIEFNSLEYKLGKIKDRIKYASQYKIFHQLGWH